MDQTWPMRKESGKGISTRGVAPPRSNSTRVHLVPSLENTEKFTPPGTRVAPKGNALPGRSW